MSVSIEQLLALPGVQVLTTEITEREVAIHVRIESNYATCHRCGQKATEFHCDGETLRLRHLPVFERPVFLYLHTKRYRCLNCDDRPTTTQHGDWYDINGHCTKAFAHSLLRELVGSTLSDVVRKHAVTYDVLRGLLLRHVSAQVDWREFDRLGVLGLDEISLLKGHRDFVTIVSTRTAAGSPVILAVLEGREKETVKAFLASIPARLRATVEAVCTDLYDGFVNAVKEVLPQAQVVADRFHVARAYRAGLDELRKIELREIKQALVPAAHAELKGALWALRRRHEDLSDEELELLELLFDCSPDLRRGYQLREKLTRIFETRQTKESARRALRRWIGEVRKSGLSCFDQFLGTLEKWMDEITNYFISRLTSGWVEGFNNRIKVLKRRCYGLKSPASLFRRLWLDLNGLEAFAD